MAKRTGAAHRGTQEDQQQHTLSQFRCHATTIKRDLLLTAGFAIGNSAAHFITVVVTQWHNHEEDCTRSMAGHEGRRLRSPMVDRTVALRAIDGAARLVDTQLGQLGRHDHRTACRMVGVRPRFAHVLECVRTACTMTCSVWHCVHVLRCVVRCALCHVCVCVLGEGGSRMIKWSVLATLHCDWGSIPKQNRRVRALVAANDDDTDAHGWPCRCRTLPCRTGHCHIVPTVSRTKRRAHRGSGTRRR